MTSRRSPFPGLSLTSKAMILLASAWAVATASVAIIHGAVVLPTFAALEEQEGRKDASRVSEAFAAVEAELARLTREWAAWEETWNYVQGRNPAYKQQNLTDETFLSLDIHAMVLLDPRGRLIWSRVIDPGTRAEISLEEFSPAAFSAGSPLAWSAETPGPYSGAVRQGLMRTSAGVLMYASCPVLRNYEQGPVRGTLIEGRFLSAGFFDALQKQIRVAFRVAFRAETPPPGGNDSAGDAPVVSRAGRFLLVSFPLRDSSGAELLRITVEREAEIIGHGRTSLYSSVALFFITLAAVITALLLLLRRTILDPIGRLTRMIVSIRTTGTFVARLGLRRGDEIGTLSANFDAMLDQLSEKARALTEMATTDPLTGLPNRRSIMEELGREGAHARRYGEPLAVLMIDIDHFKAVNDERGHAVGDEVLKGVAGTLRSIIRDSDFTGRYGGEEFLVVLPHQDERGAALAAERIRLKIASTEIGNGKLKVSVSIGVGTMGESGEAGGMEDMLLRADRALYAAKRAGRNRVSVG